MRNAFNQLLESIQTVPSPSLSTEPAAEPSPMVDELGDVFHAIWQQLSELYEAEAEDLWAIIMDVCYALEADGALPALPEDGEPDAELTQAYLAAVKTIDLPAKVLAYAAKVAGAPEPETVQ